MRLIILGSGGYGRVVSDIARQCNKYNEILFLDDNDMSEDVVGRNNEYQKFIGEDTEFYPAFGNNVFRLEWIDKLRKANAHIATIIHATSYVSPVAKIAEGTVVLPNAAVNSHTEVGVGCIINMGALIDHNCVIEEGTHICLGAIVKANNHIPKCHKVEAGQVLERGEMK